MEAHSDCIDSIVKQFTPPICTWRAEELALPAQQERLEADGANSLQGALARQKETMHVAAVEAQQSALSAQREGGGAKPNVQAIDTAAIGA